MLGAKIIYIIQLACLCVCVAGLLSDWYPNLDALKESCRIASSYNWADVDLSPFQGAVCGAARPTFFPRCSLCE